MKFKHILNVGLAGFWVHINVLKFLVTHLMETRACGVNDRKLLVSGC